MISILELRRAIDYLKKRIPNIDEYDVACAQLQLHRAVDRIAAGAEDFYAAIGYDCFNVPFGYTLVTEVWQAANGLEQEDDRLEYPPMEQLAELIKTMLNAMVLPQYAVPFPQTLQRIATLKPIRPLEKQDVATMPGARRMYYNEATGCFSALDARKTGDVMWWVAVEDVPLAAEALPGPPRAEHGGAYAESV